MWKKFIDKEWIDFYLLILYDKFKSGKEVSITMIEYFNNNMKENIDFHIFDFISSKLCLNTWERYFPFLFSIIKEKNVKSLLEIFKIIYEIIEKVMMVLVDNHNFRMNYWRLYSGNIELPVSFSKPFFYSHYDGWVPNMSYGNFYRKYSKEPELIFFKGDDYLNTIWQECCLIIEEWNEYINSIDFRECLISIFRKSAEFIFNEINNLNENRISQEDQKKFISYYILNYQKYFEDKYRFLFPFHTTDMIVKFKNPETEFMEFDFLKKIDNLIEFSKKHFQI